MTASIEPICAVVITRDPDDGLAERLRLVAEQVSLTVLVDNGSGDEKRGLILIAASSVGAELIQNETNLGIAAALNQGIRFAAARGYRWALTMDQDTEASHELVVRLRATQRAASKLGPLAAIGSNYYEGATGRPHVVPTAERDWFEVPDVITSGTLTSVVAFAAVGGFREEFFIDFVDIDFCLRARAAGFHVVLSLAPTMRHPIGRTTFHRVLWKVTGTSNHDKLRRYYMARNYAALMREHMAKRPRWALRTTLGRIKGTVLMLMFENDKMQKAELTALGLLDGARLSFRRRIGE